MGSVTLKETVLFEQLKISTHTLRGERDAKELGDFTYTNGSAAYPISTHTLRGERDQQKPKI